MKERPIIFSAPMIRRLLAGDKTQTRRILKPQPNNPEVFGVSPIRGSGVPRGEDGFTCTPRSTRKSKRVDRWLPCPQGQAGDRLWVRETWYCDDWSAGDHKEACAGCVGCKHTDSDRISEWRKHLFFRADGEPDFEGERAIWKPSIFMPRWASRITLEVVAVSVQRLKGITEADARSEGARHFPGLASTHPYGQDSRWSCGEPSATDECLGSARHAFGNLWESIYGAGSWTANPWVWRVEFKMLT